MASSYTNSSEYFLLQFDMDCGNSYQIIAPLLFVQWNVQYLPEAEKVTLPHHQNALSIKAFV